MSSFSRTSNAQPETNRTYQTTIEDYSTQETSIQHRGYIDPIKSTSNTRLLILNPRGLNPWSNYKTEMLIESCKKLQIDGLLLSETQVK